MDKSKKKQNKENAQIQYFLEDCFERYSMRYEQFFFEVDENGDMEVFPLFTNGIISEKILQHSAKILGMTTDEILKQDKEAAHRWFNKFPFFEHLIHFNNLRIASNYGEGFWQARLMQAIFGDKACKCPERYDINDIHARADKLLKDVDNYLPGTYHEGADMLEFNYETEQFISYPQIAEMMDSFLEIVERAKALFFKAWQGDLGEQEIMEYNFLVTVLDLTDLYGLCPVYYDGLKRLIPLYHKEGYQGKEEEFFDLVSIKFAKHFEPWACKEFANDAELAQRYASIYPYAKQKMFDFGRSVRYFACRFKWSDAENPTYEKSEEELFEDLMNMSKQEFNQMLDNDLAAAEAYEKNGVGELADWTRVSVSKTPEELNGDEEYAEKLIRLGGVPAKGGITIPKVKIIRLDTKEELDRAVEHANALKEAIYE